MARLLQDQVTPNGFNCLAISRARHVGRERVVVEEELLGLGKELSGMGYFRRDIFRRTHPVTVPADGLRPEAKDALGGTATAGIDTHVRVVQVADEVFFDLEVPLIHIHHPGQLIHVLNQFPLWIVNDLSIFAERQAGDIVERAPFGDFLACVVELLSAHPINDRRGQQSFFRQNRGMSSHEPNARGRLLRLDGLSHLAVILQRGRRGVNNHVLVVLRLGQTLLHVNIVRRAIEQLAARHQRRRLRQPSRIPIAGDFPAGLVPRAGAAVKTVE